MAGSDDVISITTVVVKVIYNVIDITLK